MSYHGSPGNVGAGGGGASSGDDNGGNPSTYAVGGAGSNGRIVINYQTEMPYIGDNPVDADSVCPGQANKVIHSFLLTELPLCDSTLWTRVSNISIVTSGSYLASDVNNFKLYYTTTDSFTVANLLGTINNPGAAGTKSFAGFAPITLVTEQSVYFWVTMDVSSTSGGDRTLRVLSTNPANITATETFDFSAEASGEMIFPDVRLTTTTAPDICTATNNFSFNPSSPALGATFTWRRAAVAGIAEPGTSGTGNVAETLTDTTLNPVNVTYTFTTTALGCTNAGESVVVTVNPAPNMSSTSSSTICSGETLNILLAADITSDFTWIASNNPSVDNESIVLRTTSTINDMLINNTSSPQYVTYTVIPTSNPEGCTGAAQTVTVTVNPIPYLNTSLSPASVCSGTVFNYIPDSDVSNATYSWSRASIVTINSNVSGSGSGTINETLNNASTTTVNVVYSYTTTANNCSNLGEDVVVQVYPDANLTLVSAVGTDDQHVCLNDTITDISYVFNDGVTGISYGGLPSALVVSLSGNTVTIQDSAKVEGVFNYTISTSGDCSQTTAVGRLTIGISLDTTGGSDTQHVCKATPITDIRYAIGSDSATVDGLPPGVTASFNSGVLTISGTSSTEGTYYYTVNTFGTCTTPSSKEGMIVVGAGAVDSSLISQEICKDEFIQPIVYNIVGGGSPIASVTGLEGSGLTGVVSNSGNPGIFTISGQGVQEGTYVYTVATATNGACGSVSVITGTITIGVGAVDSSLISQEICKDDFIQPIVFNIVGGGSPIASVTGLEGSGLTGVVSNSGNPGTFTISGQGTNAGTYVYTVSTATNGACGSISTKTGTITIGAGAVDTSLVSQEICKDDFIQPIVFNIVGGGTPIARVTGLEGSGLTGVVSNSSNPGIFTISGQGTNAGTYVYTVSTATNGACGSISTKTGTITIGAGAVDTSLVSQEICKDDFIQPIVFNIVGGGNPIASVSGLEGSGLTGVVSNSGNPGTFTISGQGTNAGTYVYTVSTATNGVCGSISTKTGTITIGAGAVDTSLVSQEICKDDFIQPIVFNIVGGGSPIARVSGLEGSGLTGVVSNSGNPGTFTISGQGTNAGIYVYTVSTATNGACGSVSTQTGTITIGAGAVDTSLVSQEICKDDFIQPIVFNIVGGGSPIASVRGLEGSGLTGVVSNSGNPGIFTISGQGTNAGTYVYTVSTATNGACGSISIKTGTITIGAGAVDSSLISQEICKDDFIQPIVFNIVGGGSPIASVSGLEGSGLTGVVSNSGNPGTFTISGQGTNAGTYVYTVSTATNGACGSVSMITGTITIGAGAVDTSLISQEICIGSSLQPIVFNIVGGGSPIASVSGLEGSGLTGVVSNSGNPGIFTISGTGTQEGTYVYTVSTATNGACGTISRITGTITIGAGAVDSSLINQSICKDGPLQPIVFNIVGGGSPIASVTGLEGSGLTGQVTNPGNPGIFTISGIGTQEGTYVYTVSSATNGACGTISRITGTITIGAGAVDSSLINQSICKDAPLQPIVFNIVGGGNPIASVSGLAGSGLMGVVSNPGNPGVFTISGIGAQEGTYVYTVNTPTNGACGTASILTGTIVIGIGSSSSGNDDQTICIGDSITTIRYLLPLPLVTGAESFGLPEGIRAEIVANQYVIQGTPTVSGTYNYTVTAMSTCTSVSSMTGTIVIKRDTLNITSSNNYQLLCTNQPIDNIEFLISGSGSSASLYPGSSGISGNLSGNIYTITGVPPATSGIYTYTVATAGTCSQGGAKQTFTLQVVDPQASFTPSYIEGIIPMSVSFTNESNEDALTYNWSFGDGSTYTDKEAKYTYNNPGEYEAKLVVSYNGLCADSISYTIKAKKLLIPNVFTPNGDGINDLFVSNLTDAYKLELTVFNRWGIKVAELNNALEAWDGKDFYTNLECPSGTYYYVFKIMDPDNNQIIEKGTVLISK